MCCSSFNLQAIQTVFSPAVAARILSQNAYSGDTTTEQPEGNVVHSRLPHLRRASASLVATFTTPAIAP